MNRFRDVANTCVTPHTFRVPFFKISHPHPHPHGIKGNASKKSHEELDQCTELDEGNPEEFGEDMKELLFKFQNFNILGGCCGTDCRHVEQICKSCIDIFNKRK